jgi:hypothetical protein
LPGKCMDLFIGTDSRNKRGGIQGVVIPMGAAAKGAGRLQGMKRVPRPSPHPVFGLMSRLFILVDELEVVPPGLYKDFDNIYSNVLDASDRGFKVAASYNPKDPGLRPYRMAEPEKGWSRLDPEVDETWMSKEGWAVVRLDAAKSENVVQQRVVFPGLQTYAGYQQLLKASGGEDSPSFWTFGRGLYPPMGGAQTMFTQELLEQRLGEPLFIGPTNACAGVDLALEGGDRAWLVPGVFGTATGIRIGTKITPFTDIRGEPMTKPVLFVREPVPLPKSETVEMARNVKMEAAARLIEPRWLCVDRTGVGTGVHDLLKGLWSSDVQGLNYTESASESKVLLEEAGTAKELYGRAVAELWFAARRLVEHAFVIFDPKADWIELWKQLTARKYEPGRGNKVESKREYRSRGNKSPDIADAFTLLIHAMRKASGVSFSVSQHTNYEGSQPVVDDSEYEDIAYGHGGGDPANEIDYLEQDNE